MPIASGEDLMSMLLNYVKSFVREEEGQDLLEYALLVALIALVAIGAVGAAGVSVNNIFTSIAGQLAAAA
jgi:pilus assembly protein Flp/PilA